MHACVLAFALLCACAGSARDELSIPAPAPGAPAVLTPAPLGSLTGAQALGDLYLGGQPSSDDLALFAERGGRTVITLRTNEEPVGFDEPARVAELGLGYESLPFAKPVQLDDAVFARARTLLTESPRPLLLHCASGNRVGALWIPWRVLDGGVELEAAVAEARAMGLKSAEYEAKARDYVARHGRG